MKITIEIKDNHIGEFMEGYQKITSKQLKEYIKDYLYQTYYDGKKKLAIENLEPDVITTIVSVK